MQPDDQNVPRDEPLWDFALRLYGAEGVSVICLDLQDSHAADIPLLLYAAWLGAVRFHALSRAEARHARDAIRDWHEEIVRPLRAVRRRMKSGPRPAPGPDTEALRDGLKGVELGAEKIELALLEQIAPPPGTLTQASADTIARNMALVLEPAAVTPLAEDAMSSLKHIARAAAARAPAR